MSITYIPSQHQYAGLSAQLRQQLVDTLVTSGVLHSPRLRDAFLTVPREPFVPTFYEQDESGRLEWKQVNEHQIPQEEYVATVYSDQSVIVKIDEQNWPISSSSRPSAMAKMLEALDLGAGQRVLEIGTGTGYNAALLSLMANDPQCVTTIDIDETLVKDAARVLNMASGPGMTVVCGDGFQGYAPNAPYDRIIATASVPCIPHAWLTQLALDGRLVMDLQGTLTSGFLVIEKTVEGINGHFLAEPLHFMPLVTKDVAESRIANVAPLLQQPCQGTFTLDKDHVFPNVLLDSPFRWFLQWRIAGCQMRKQKQTQRETRQAIHVLFLVDQKRKSLLRLWQQQGEETWQGSVYGPEPLWDELQQAYNDFVALGEPSPTQYHVKVDAGKPVVCIGSFKFAI